MTFNLPPEDQPPRDWRRWAEPGEAENALPEPSLTDPVAVAVMFFNALQDPKHYLTALLNLSTPESHAAWGDFTVASQMLASVEDGGIGSMVNEAHGDPNVVYAKILRGVTSSYQVLDDQPVLAAAVLSLVWRPEHNQWMVHAIGEPVLPEDVPHG